MIFYHGTTEESAKSLKENPVYDPQYVVHVYDPKYDVNGDNGIWVTDRFEYAEQFGEWIVEIVVDKKYAPELIHMEETLWEYESVNSYLIPSHIPFKVRRIREPEYMKYRRKYMEELKKLKSKRA